MFVLPPIEDIRRIVEEEIPEGHHVLSVELTGDPAASLGTAPFALVVRVREEPDAGEAAGVGYNIAERIRKRWAAENVYVRMEWSCSSDGSL